jgi:DNA-binding transcriptional LysR family regulator
MELRDIEYFSVIAEHHHLGRAAEALKLSTSALSKSLHRLEHTLQVKLVTRTPTGVELTPEGAALQAHAQRLQLSLTDVAREVSELRRGLSGQLRVGSHPGLIDIVILPASVALFSEPSKVVLTVSIGDYNVLVPAVRNGELDLIVSGIPDVPYDDVIQEHLYDDDYVVFASANHRLARRKQVTLADIAQESWAMTTPTIEEWTTLRRAFEDSRLPPPRIAMVSLVTSLRVRTIALTQLLGIISRRMFERARAELPLVELPVNQVLYRRQVAIGYRKGAYLSPAARRFTDLLKAAAKDVTAQTLQRMPRSLERR